MDVILRRSPVVNTNPNLPRSPIMRLPNQAGRNLAASSESVMRVHVNVLVLSRHEVRTVSHAPSDYRYLEAAWIAAGWPRRLPAGWHQPERRAKILPVEPEH